MNSLFNINPDIFVDKTVQLSQNMTMPDTAIQLWDEMKYYCVVLQDDSIPLCTLCCASITGIKVLPIEVFTECREVINSLHVGKVLPSDDRYHLDMQADIWKKCPGFKRDALKEACEKYQPMDGIIRLCNNDNRTVFVYITDDTFVNKKQIRFEVIDYSDGNNANSVGFYLNAYEQICQIIDGK